VSIVARGAEPQEQLKKLARRGSASVVGAGFSAVSGIVLVVIVTRGFSPQLAGTLFAATSAFLIVESIALLGTDGGLVRWLPAHLVSGRARDVRTTLVVSAAPVLLVSLLTAGVLFAAAPRLADVLVGQDSEAAMSTALQVLALLLPIASLHDLVLAGTRGVGTMRPTIMVENLGRLALQAALVLVVCLAGLGVLGLVLAWSLPYVVALACSGLWLLRLLGRQAEAATASPRSWRSVASEFWAYTTPRAIARVTQTALKRSDIVMVAALSSLADAALYTAATRFVVFGQLLVQSVQQALAPHLSSLFASNEAAAARSIFQAATAWSMLPAWPIYLVTAAFAPDLLRIFGSDYDQASAVVVILSLTMLVATACGPVDSVLLMAGRSWLSLVNGSVALVLNLALNALLIPAYGITGAAIAWSAAIVVRNVLPLFQVRRMLSMWPGTAASAMVAAGALVCFGLPAVVARAAALSTTAEIAITCAGAGVYLVGVWLLRAPLGLEAFRTALARRGQRRDKQGSVTARP
jgi:O-antigen/teichoic acid export membrane protein